MITVLELGLTVMAKGKKGSRMNCKVDSVAALAQAALVPSVLDLIRSFDTTPSDIYPQRD